MNDQEGITSRLQKPETFGCGTYRGWAEGRILEFSPWGFGFWGWDSESHTTWEEG